MKIKLITISFLLSSFIISCGGSEKPSKVEKTNKVEQESKIEKENETIVNEVIEEEVSKEDINIGIGPIKSIKLSSIDDALAEKGKALYKANCTACHKIGSKLIGPALKGITERRSPEWIMNMILNPEEMIAKDPIAMDLLAEYKSPMANQGLTEDEARALLEYFRKHK